jgi:hypothetical protein
MACCKLGSVLSLVGTLTATFTLTIKKLYEEWGDFKNKQGGTQ